jgi:hypothetical protein
MPTLLLSLACTASSALAQVPPDYGYEWRTVGSPGNAPAQTSDFPFSIPGPRGGVDYEFRMSRTEVTVAQYFEFVQAYTTVYPNAPYDNAIAGTFIYRTGSAGSFQWHIIPNSSDLPADMGWNYAATYCNWLCNGKAVSPAAFASGAYDTSTFYPNPGDPQVVHTPGAPFWLPSVDEWTKAMFYDPNKNGAGQAGYWWYPTRSDTPPVGGPPGTPGAQTGAGDYTESPDNPFRDYPVGSYPDTQSPWGLLDGSGGVREWIEGPNSYEFRFDVGSSNHSTFLEWEDRIGQNRSDAFWAAASGLRLASSIPTPGSGVLLLLLAGVSVRTRRR